MAILTVLSVFDMTAEQYGRPFFSINDASAIRSFELEVNRPAEDSMLYMHPEDFQLFLLGQFDDTKGQFLLLDVPQLLAKGGVVARRPGVVSEANGGGNPVGPVSEGVVHG